MVLNKYCCFSGRASRSEFWFWTLGLAIAQVIIGMVLKMIGASLEITQVVSGLFTLAVILPNLGVAVRRLHDTGRAGGWIFINLIPFVGQILYIIWLCQPSQVGDNRFGPMPNLVESTL